MSRIIAIAACGFALAACSMSMPSLDFIRSGPPTEVLRIESEPPGADARTALGETCRTPCELTVPSTADTAVTFALNGYQPLTVPVRTDGASARLQPNPVYAELQPMAPARPGRKGTGAKKKAAGKRAPSATSQNQAPAAEPPPPAAPSGYPWPPAPQ
jgi:hypothetical protein